MVLVSQFPFVHVNSKLLYFPTSYIARVLVFTFCFVFSAVGLYVRGEFSYSTSSVFLRKLVNGEPGPASSTESAAMVFGSTSAVATAQATVTTESITVATEESGIVRTTTTTTTSTVFATAGVPATSAKVPDFSEPPIHVPSTTPQTSCVGDFVALDLSEYVCRLVDSYSVCYSDDSQMCIRVHSHIRPASVKAVSISEILLDICSGYSNYDEVMC